MHADAITLAQGSRRRRRSGADGRTVVEGLVRLGDVAIVALSGIAASLLRFGGEAQPDVVTTALLTGVLFAAAIFALFHLYEAGRLAQLTHQLPRLLMGWLATIAAVLAVLFSIKSSGTLSRLWVGYWLLAGAGGLVAWRVLVRHVIHTAQAHGRLRPRLLLVGDTALMADCLARLGSGPAGPLIAGALALDGEPPALPPGSTRVPCLAALEAAVRDTHANQVILTVPLRRTAEIHGLLRRLKHLPIDVSLYPDLIGRDLPVFGLTRLADTPLVQLLQRPLDGWSYLLKSLEDRVLAALLLLLISPAFAAVALAVHLTSPGPVFYRQLRRGFNGEPILVFKFRTLHAHRCDPPGALHVRQVTRDDDRVTPIGRLLRRTSLDELPQLLNVARGEMSLVGPRPHAVSHDDHYSRLIDDYLGRQRVKPGMTGWAQVNGCRGETRSVEEMRRRIELDLEYIERWSLLMDLRILLRTIFAGFGGQYAY